jgi:Cys-rich protein (TIGR01571 family)
VLRLYFLCMSTLLTAPAWFTVLESICCPCVLTGRTHSRLHDPENPHQNGTNFYCAGCCALSFVTLGILPLFCFMTSAQRREIRYRYNIRGNNGVDCLKATFCVWCSLVQEEKEVVWREEQKKLASSVSQLAKREDHMQYSPPS